MAATHSVQRFCLRHAGGETNPRFGLQGLDDGGVPQYGSVRSAQPEAEGAEIVERAELAWVLRDDKPEGVFRFCEIPQGQLAFGLLNLGIDGWLGHCCNPPDPIVGREQ